MKPKIMTNHTGCLLKADALSDARCEFSLPTSHVGDHQFPYKDTRQQLHGAAPRFWVGAACGLLGSAIWFPSLQGSLGDGRACCLITTSKNFLAPLVYVKKRAEQHLLSDSDEGLKSTSVQLLLSSCSRSLSVCVCVQWLAPNHYLLFVLLHVVVRVNAV